MMLLDFRGGPNLYVIPKGALRELESLRRLLPPFKCEHHLYLLCAAYTEYGVECIAMPKASTTATPNANHQLHHQTSPSSINQNKYQKF